MVDRDAFADPGSFVGPVVVVRRIASTPEYLFRCFTDGELMSRWMSAPVTIELEIGGAYEILFDETQSPGLQGSEGCQVLTFIPDELLAFTWNAPPSLLEIRNSLTFVILRFTRVADGTIVTLTHAGHGRGKVWDQNREYFIRAWALLFDALESWLEENPTDR
ncbi:MAG: SRPBCC domain-containing protein [Acidimicrobiia bacterium]|nr:SRPBCC domain-containing protein [Acidimicrobiia bacterium]